MKSFLLFIFFLQFLSFTHLGLAALPNQHGLSNDKLRTLKVFHRSIPCSPLNPTKTMMTWEDCVIQDMTRQQHLTSLKSQKSNNAPLAWALDLIKSPTYVVNVKVGTPPQNFLMTLDTRFGASWLPCNGCVGCGSTLFAPEKSTSFKHIACGTPPCQQVTNSNCSQNLCTYNQTYGPYTFAATLSQDTVFVDQDPLPSHFFGCIQKSSGAPRQVPPQGLLGLGRGPFSFLSQTHSVYKSTFSYCLSSHFSSNFTGSFRLGPVGQPKKMNYTKLLVNPRRPSLYYVNLLGIKVGSKILDIPADAFAFNPTNGGGTIIDSGTVFTLLTKPAYTAVRDEIIRRMGKAKVLTRDFDTCYSHNDPIKVRSITFMFENMNLKLGTNNFLITESSTNITCLAMVPSPANLTLNVFANFQQENHRVFFDIPNNRVGIARETCT